MIVACDETNGEISDTSCDASTKRIGMIHVAISSLSGMSSGLLPVLTGFLPLLIASLVLILKVLPVRTAAKPFLFSSEFNKSTASSLVKDWPMTVTDPLIRGASIWMMKPAALLRCSSTRSIGALRKFRFRPFVLAPLAPDAGAFVEGTVGWFSEAGAGACASTAGALVATTGS